MMRGPQKHHNNVAVHRLARRLLRDAATHMNGRWARGESQRSGVNPLIVQRPDDTNKAKGAVIHAAVMDEDRKSSRFQSLMSISYDVFCLKKTKYTHIKKPT